MGQLNPTVLCRRGLCAGTKTIKDDRNFISSFQVIMNPPMGHFGIGTQSRVVTPSITLMR